MKIFPAYNGLRKISVHHLDQMNSLLLYSIKSKLIPALCEKYILVYLKTTDSRGYVGAEKLGNNK